MGGRKPVMDGKLYDSLVDKLVKDHQYDVSKLRKVPQKWTAEERKKIGVSVEECPDEMLATLNEYDEWRWGSSTCATLDFPIFVHKVLWSNIVLELHCNRLNDSCSTSYDKKIL